MEIADFNRDGMFDLIFLTQEGELTILYNQFSPKGPKSEDLCQETGDTNALRNNQLFANYPFEAGEHVILESYEGWDEKTYSFEGINPSIKRKNPLGVPGRLRVADLDKDGFPDIIITLDFKNKKTSEHTSRTVILTN